MIALASAVIAAGAIVITNQTNHNPGNEVPAFAAKYSVFEAVFIGYISMGMSATCRD